MKRFFALCVICALFVPFARASAPSPAAGAAAASATGYACGALVAWAFFKRTTASPGLTAPAREGQTWLH